MPTLTPTRIAAPDPLTGAMEKPAPVACRIDYLSTAWLWCWGLQWKGPRRALVCGAAPNGTVSIAVFMDPATDGATGNMVKHFTKVSVYARHEDAPEKPPAFGAKCYCTLPEASEGASGNGGE